MALSKGSSLCNRLWIAAKTSGNRIRGRDPALPRAAIRLRFLLFCQALRVRLLGGVDDPDVRSDFYLRPSARSGSELGDCSVHLRPILILLFHAKSAACWRSGHCSSSTLIC